MPHPTHRPVPIAVVGLGALLPGAPDPGEFWRAVVAGRDLITDVPASRWLPEDHYDPDPAATDKTYAYRGAFLSHVDFEPMAHGIPPTMVPATDPVQLLSLMVADQVLADAGGLAGVDRDRVGVVLGAATLELLPHMHARTQRPVWLKALRESGVPEATALDVCDRISGHFTPWQESSFPGMLTSVVAGRIANRFDLHGLNHTTDAACASSLAALSTAVNELTTGRADLMISGGADTSNDIAAYMCFSKTPALSPTGDCRPWSEAADGTALGEGVVMFALKRLSDAERDGDRIYAVIRGIGASSDGGDTSIYGPLAEGQARALRRAYAEAGYDPATVELVEAHGTGTKAGDAAEFAALREVFEQSGRTDRQWCALGSAKSQYGHTKCAAGAVGLLKAVLALHHRVLPPTIKVDRPNPALHVEDSAFHVNTVARPWTRTGDHPRRASVSSFGFGGTNFHVALEEYTPARARPRGRQVWRARAASTELVLFSAESPDSLLGHEIDGALPIARLARESQRAYAATAPVRLAIVAEDGDDLIDKFARAAAMIRGRPDTGFTTPTGVHYSPRPPAPGKVGFLFPGQGAQYVDMGAGLAMALPAAQDVWDRLGGAAPGGTAPHRTVFPPPAFTDAERTARQKALNATECAQPALAVHSLALLAVLRDLGLTPDCVAGHSFGELTALHAAGVLDAEALVALARRRGELMRDAATVPGAMLAVTASTARTEEAVAACGARDLWIANHNAPDQTVLSGATTAIEAVEAALAADGVATRRLSAATGFHSPLVAPARAPFEEFLHGTALRAPGLPVYANADASPYPEAPDDVRSRIAEHLTGPVLFEAGITAMYADGVRTFVEVGAGDTLTGLVGRVLGTREHLAVSLDRRGRDGLTMLHDALGRLAVRGIELDYEALWAPYGPAQAPTEERKATMTVPIDGGPTGRRYPPTDGMPQQAAPQQAAAPVPVPPAPSPVPPPPGHSAEAEPDDRRLVLVERAQQQVTEAHVAFHRMLVDSHIEFLRMAETSFAALLGPVRDRVPNPSPVAPVPVPEPVPSAPVSLPEQTAAPEPVDVSVSAHVPTPVPVPVPVPHGDAVIALVAPPPAAAAPVLIEQRSEAVSAPPFADLLLSAVAELTGYPVEMLDLDMNLQSDLGVDSIKRVEILSVVRERMGDLSDGDIAELRKVRTLRDVVDLVDTLADGAPTRVAGAPQAEAESGTDTPGPCEAPAPPVTVGRVAVRVVETPAPGLMTAGLGDGPVLVVDGGSSIAGAVVNRLAEHGIRAETVTTLPADAHAVLHLGGLAPITSPDDAKRIQRDVFRAARSVAPHFGAHGGLFVTVQDTGGDFGLDARTPDRAWLGGIAALTRTAAREWPAARVKAVDCERGDRGDEAVAAAIVDELLHGGAALDVGLRADGTRVTPRTELAPVTPGPVSHLGPDAVIVATGGARGVTAAALLELARAHRPRIALLGRTELTPEPPGLEDAADEGALTRALVGRAGAGADPAAITAQVRAILAAREARATLAELERAGSAARYLPVDIRDAAAVATALADIRRDWGPVTGLVHGAGVVADALIADKTDAQFDYVMDTKVDGLRSLLDATADDPLASILLFSSGAGTFGNAAQCDYSMANEVLNHVAGAERARRPGCLVRSIGWGPWRGGMVTPLTAEHFIRIGVPVMPVDRGATAFVAEAADRTDTPRVFVAAADARGVPGTGLVHEPRPAEVRVRTRTHPYLADHAVAGTPVLPMAMALNWFVGAAETWRPTTDVVIRGLRVLDKVLLPDLDGDGHLLTVRGRRAKDSGTALEVELCGDRPMPHYRATFDCGAEVPPPAAWEDDSPLVLTADLADLADLGDLGDLGDPYDGRLFHGPAFRVIRSLHRIGADGAEATVTGLADRAWPGAHWPLDPAAVDGGLQVAGLWAAHVTGGACLPMAVGECRRRRRGPITDAVRCVVRPGKVRESRARCDLALIDPDGVPRIELLDVEFVRHSV